MKNLKKFSFALAIGSLLIHSSPASADFSVSLADLYRKITGYFTTSQKPIYFPLFFLGTQDIHGYFTSNVGEDYRRLFFVKNNAQNELEVYTRSLMLTREISRRWLNSFKFFNKTEHLFDGLPITISEIAQDTFSEPSKINGALLVSGLGLSFFKRELNENYNKPTEEEIAELDAALEKGVKPHQLTNVFFDTTQTAQQLSNMVECFSDKGYCVVGSDKKNSPLSPTYENLVRERAKKALSKNK